MHYRLKREHVSLTLVGDGPERSMLERMTDELQIREVTKFIPWIQRAELADLYRSSDVFLFPHTKEQAWSYPKR